MKITDTHLDPTLCRAVIRALGGRDYLADVARHGAASGFPGFTYYRDTDRFYRRHRAAINALVMELARDFGEDPVSMVDGFGCLKDSSDDEQRDSIGRAIYGGRLTDSHSDTLVTNALAWLALEEVARALEPDA